ncbi:MAG: hypothetical protein QOH90_1183 [Actinomycetota bacterium]|nr:hypothetical protein [Actinomycetota bacterium]
MKKLFPALLALVFLVACDRSTPRVAIATTTSVASPPPATPSHVQKKTRNFNRYCSKALAWGSGDFDGDSLRDQIHFTRGGKPGRLNATRWNVELVLGTGESSTGYALAHCPERIGPLDLDGDGRDEFFYDTGSGMTAAMVDLMRFNGHVMKNIPHGLQDWFYVGASNAGTGTLECLRDASGAHVVTTDAYNPLPPRKRGRAIITTYQYVAGRLTPESEVHARRKAWFGGSLDCFGLHWAGY